MTKIHIGGVYYGCHNIGDEAILLSMINSFKNNNIVSVSTYDSDWIDCMFPDVERHIIPMRFQKPKYGIYSLPRRNVLKDLGKIHNEIMYLKSKDVYLCGGATILSDCPWYSLRTVQLAAKAGIASYLWGVGMAELDDKDTLAYIRRVLNNANIKRIYTRDELVQERLVKLGVIADKVGICYDPAIMLEGTSCTFEHYMSEEQLSLYRNGKTNLVVTLSGEADVKKRTPVDVILKAVSEVQKKYDANVFLIPTGCGAHCKDAEFLQMMAEKMDSVRVTIITKEFAPNDLVEFLKNVKIIISSRLHMNIFGACAGTPSIGLVRNRKIIDFASLLGLPYLKLEKLTESSIKSSVDDIFDDYEKYLCNMNNVVNKMRKQHRMAIDELKKIVEK